MRKFSNAKITLFDSTNAQFKLAVEAQFTRGNQEQGYRDLVYITEKYTANLNPNIYLTLTYKDDSATPVYTSYPQLFRLREAFGKVKSTILDGSGFMDTEGICTVKPGADEPVVVANIGKNNNWISLKLVVIKSGENGVMNYVPGVSIEMSTSNGYAAVLTTEEFLTVTTIIDDLNLIDLQTMLSLAFLDTPIQQQGYYNVPTQQYQQSVQPQYQGGVYQQYQQPQYNAGGYQQQYNKPRYNGNGYRPAQTQQSYRTTASTSPAPQQRQMTPAEEAKADADNWLSKNPQFPTQNNLPPRTSGKPIMTKDAIEETPVSSIDYDDNDALNSIFED